MYPSLLVAQPSSYFLLCRSLLFSSQLLAQFERCNLSLQIRPSLAMPFQIKLPLSSLPLLLLLLFLCNYLLASTSSHFHCQTSQFYQRGRLGSFFFWFHVQEVHSKQFPCSLSFYSSFCLLLYFNILPKQTPTLMGSKEKLRRHNVL